MTGNRRPEYTNHFTYMVENLDMPKKASPKERFWAMDLEKNQYPYLEGAVSDERVHFSDPESAASVIRDFARDCGADVFGTTSVTDEMIFRGADVRGKYAVSLGVEMKKEMIDTAPDPPAGIEALRAYWKVGYVIMEVSRFIRNMGYPAQGHQVRTFTGDPPTVLHTVAALFSGLGEMGRMGLLINRDFGPRLRLGTVTCDIELPDTGKRPFGVEDLCSRCQICADECRGGAIPREKTRVRGVEKYTIQPEKCLPEFARYDGCGICLKVCPFNRRGEDMPRFPKTNGDPGDD